MEKKQYTDREKHHYSLTRIAKALGFNSEVARGKQVYDLEDVICGVLEQRRLEMRRLRRTITDLEGEIDMLRQTSIFDFLKVHHEEIRRSTRDNTCEDNG